jgi:hypothetical protein
MANMKAVPVLCRGIIELALLDAARNASARRIEKKRAADARSFITSDWCRALCDAAGLEYGMLVKAAQV